MNKYLFLNTQNTNKYLELHFLLLNAVLFTFSEVPSVTLSKHHIKMCGSIILVAELTPTWSKESVVLVQVESVSGKEVRLDNFFWQQGWKWGLEKSDELAPTWNGFKVKQCL